MTLNEYLKNRALQGQRPNQAPPEVQYHVVRAFAEKIGVSAKSVYRYLNGERFPHPDVMRRIVEETDGAVQPMDFLQPEESGEIWPQDLPRGAADSL